MILVTGSAGHLGEALIRTLRASGRVGIDILPSPFTDRVGSIADRDFVQQSMRGVRTVLHRPLCTSRMWPRIRIGNSSTPTSLGR